MKKLNRIYQEDPVVEILAMCWTIPLFYVKTTRKLIQENLLLPTI